MDSSPTSFIDSMKACIIQALDATYVEIIDESHKHAGHKGSTGGGHYKVFIVSNTFIGLSRLQQHQKVLDLFKGAIPHTIHALSIKTMTVSDYADLKTKVSS